MMTLLLCTDLDRTLLPNGLQPESAQARPYFRQLVAQPEVTLVFVSGRDRSLIQQAIDDYHLPMPDFVISDVGSNIYDLRSGSWQLWPAWHREIALDWGLGKDLMALLDDFDGLQLQEPSKQNTYKVSFYIPMNMDTVPLAKQIEQRLSSQHIHANLIWSIDEPAQTGLLDILPTRADKLHAIDFLRRAQQMRHQDILFAGDSGNDLPVLSSNIPAVLVANATPGLRQTAQAAAEALGNSAALYMAKGEFLGLNGNYSGGILEGVAHYFPDLLHSFQE